MLTWSLKIARVFGIAIYLHWTFLILLGWIVFVHVAQGQSAIQALEGLLFVLSLFGCVVLHELGHALTARQFGIQTRDITLLPIGGIARLERLPDAPWQEFLVAVAGPAVNVVIAVLLFVALAAMGAVEQVAQAQVVGGLFLAKLLWVNVGLAVFNMLPAFPMDGGRVLRALLAMRMTRVQATNIAAAVGQGMAILLGLAGLVTGLWALLFIALFVYLGAQAEAQAMEIRSLFQSARVRDAMMTRFETLSGADTLTKAADMLLAGDQQDFPVVTSGQLDGILLRQDLVEALSQPRNGATVETVCRKCPIVLPDDSLDQAVELMKEHGCSAIPVAADDRLVGLLTNENIGEWAMLHAARNARGSNGTLRTAA